MRNSKKNTRLAVRNKQLELGFGVSRKKLTGACGTTGRLPEWRNRPMFYILKQRPQTDGLGGEVFSLASSVLQHADF